MKRKGLGDQQAMAYLRIGKLATAAMADTGSPRTIVGAEIAEQSRATPTGKTGTMNIAGHKLHGQIMTIQMETIDGNCSTSVDAFVPNRGQAFRKGIILGMDFMQKTKMKIDAATGEAFCPIPRRRRRRAT